MSAELRAGDDLVRTDPVDGGRIVQIAAGGTRLLVDDQRCGPLGRGCYPMVPWAGRVAGARFTFDGVEQHLAPTMRPHAIHGTGWQQEWRVDEHTATTLTISVELDWPLGGTAIQHLQLTPGQLTCELRVTADHRPSPAVIGWHPWFRAPRATELRFGKMYRRNAAGLPTGELVAPKPPPWDDCFIEPQGPLRLTIENVDVTIASDCNHWVVFDHKARGTCVEPQSGPPDAFHIGGTTRLEPGESMVRTMTIHWSATSAVTGG